MGSWKMMEMAPPRMVRISGPARSSLAMSIGPPSLTRGSSNRIEPEGMVAVRGSSPMMAWLHTDLPEPDSPTRARVPPRSEEHTSELQSLAYLVCRLLLEKKKQESKKKKQISRNKNTIKDN